MEPTEGGNPPPDGNPDITTDKQENPVESDPQPAATLEATESATPDTQDSVPPVETAQSTQPETETEPTQTPQATQPSETPQPEQPSEPQNNDVSSQPWPAVGGLRVPDEVTLLFCNLSMVTSPDRLAHECMRASVGGRVSFVQLPTRSQLPGNLEKPEEPEKPPQEPQEEPQEDENKMQEDDDEKITPATETPPAAPTDEAAANTSSSTTQADTTTTGTATASAEEKTEEASTPTTTTTAATAAAETTIIAAAPATTATEAEKKPAKTQEKWNADHMGFGWVSMPRYSGYHLYHAVMTMGTEEGDLSGAICDFSLSGNVYDEEFLKNPNVFPKILCFPNIPHNLGKEGTPEAELRRTCEKYGSITRVQFITPYGKQSSTRAYVHFNQPHQAEEARQGMWDSELEGEYTTVRAYPYLMMAEPNTRNRIRSQQTPIVNRGELRNPVWHPSIWGNMGRPKEGRRNYYRQQQQGNWDRRRPQDEYYQRGGAAWPAGGDANWNNYGYAQQDWPAGGAYQQGGGAWYQQQQQQRYQPQQQQPTAQQQEWSRQWTEYYARMGQQPQQQWSYQHQQQQPQQPQQRQVQVQVHSQDKQHQLQQPTSQQQQQQQGTDPKQQAQWAAQWQQYYAQQGAQQQQWAQQWASYSQHQAAQQAQYTAQWQQYYANMQQHMQPGGEPPHKQQKRQ